MYEGIVLAFAPALFIIPGRGRGKKILSNHGVYLQWHEEVPDETNIPFIFLSYRGSITCL